jgi:MFS family permease
VAATTEDRSGAARVVLLTLAAGQFLMTLDSSVMNVSIATVAKDVGTTVTGIQTAITLYTLVMATLMITGGKLGQILGHKRAFGIGCVIYGCGSFIALTRRMAASQAQPQVRLDLVGTALSALGLGLIVFRNPQGRYLGVRPAQTRRA